jgi:hypothetical protein
MRTRILSLLVALVSVGEGPAAQSATTYPLSLTLDAHIKTEATTLTSALTIRVDAPTPQFRRTRITDALKSGGYPNFLTALRALPPIGVIETERRKVEIHYAHEEPAEAGRRLILVADRPLFFLSRDPDKKRAGYELTLVELRFDAAGGVTGTMTGAARVRPSPQGDGGVVLDDYADVPVQLTSRTAGRSQ